jgi:hypothetical protein
VWEYRVRQAGLLRLKELQQILAVMVATAVCVWLLLNLSASVDSVVPTQVRFLARLQLGAEVRSPRSRLCFTGIPKDQDQICSRMPQPSR